MNTITLDKFGGDLAGQIYRAIRADQCDPNLEGYYAICSLSIWVITFKVYSFGTLLNL